MGFFRRLFSADFRAALAAEAAGDLVAAERYALAGHREAAVRVHLARARRADSRADEIAALRDALHWAPAEGDSRRLAAAALGDALLARCRAEGVATARDRERVREAARLLGDAGEWGTAGDAWEMLGEDAEAVRAFERGGLLDRMERAMAREQERAERTRRITQGFADYELHVRGGDRDAARDALRACVEAAGERGGEHRRLLDELESRLIAGGQLALRRRGGATTIYCCGPRIVLGRDPLCELVLRSGGVSRQHAAIELRAGAGGTAFLLSDVESRNGTLLGGLPLAGAVPLLERGGFALGEDCEVEFTATATPPALVLRVTRGLDRGVILRAAPEGATIPLGEPEAALAGIRFRRGRPLLEAEVPGRVVKLNGELVGRGTIQLIHGDQIAIAELELEVV